MDHTAADYTLTDYAKCYSGRYKGGQMSPSYFEEWERERAPLKCRSGNDSPLLCDLKRNECSFQVLIVKLNVLTTKTSYFTHHNSLLIFNKI